MPAADSAAITSTIDDTALSSDGALAVALDTQVVWVLHKSSTEPVGPYCIPTKSGTGRWNAPVPSLVSGIALGTPRVRQTNIGTVKPGLTRQGDAVDCYGSILLSIDGLPELLRTDPTYKCQIELGRYASKRKKKTRKTGTIVMPQGFYHPSPYIAGTGGSGSGGTRGGNQNVPGGAAVNRPSEWPVAGLGVGGGITVTVGDVFAPWSQVVTLTDIATGATVKTLSFTNKKNLGAKRPPGYKGGKPVGIFAFRYAFWDATTKRWVSGPWSEPVYVRPKGYPMGTNPAFPGSFPANDVSLAQRPTMLELACSVGGRVR
jgi:hypothetical protein